MKPKEIQNARLVNKTRLLRAAGYRRVSMREQVDQFSLTAQENSITKYANEQGWKLVKIYEDAGISAKKEVAAHHLKNYWTMQN